MKKAIALFALLVLVGCDKKETAPTATTATATPAKPAVTQSAAPVAKPTESAAPAPSASAAEDKAEAEENEQEGLEKGEVVVGYIQDLKDEGQCAALAAKESEKAKFDEKKIEEVAKMQKAKVVKSCPTENVQGTCRTMGMLINYIGPKYTPESAKKHCTQNKGKFFE